MWICRTCIDILANCLNSLLTLFYVILKKKFIIFRVFTNTVYVVLVDLTIFDTKLSEMKVGKPNHLNIHRLEISRKNDIQNG